MIIRALRLRHGRLALPQPLTPSPSPSLTRRRYQSSQNTDQHNVESEQLNAPVFLSKDHFAAQKQPDTIASTLPAATNDPDHPVARDYAFFQHQKAHTRDLGASIAPHYKPHTLVTKPPNPEDITLELLLASQTHIGHATALWHPANARYIFGVRGRKAANESPIHIISLETTAAHLRRACDIVRGTTLRGGLVLFVGTRSGQARAVVKAAELSQGCHLFTKWIPGSITNGQQILRHCEMKVVNQFDEVVHGFEDQLQQIAVLKPDLVVCLNPLENYVLLHECGTNNIPTIGIVDTNVNPTWVTYPIPANDDSQRSVQVIAGVLGRAGQQGQEKRRNLGRKGKILYHPPIGLDQSAQAKSKKSRPKTQMFRRTLAENQTDLSAPQDGEINLPDLVPSIDAEQDELDEGLLREEVAEMTKTDGAPTNATEEAEP